MELFTKVCSVWCFDYMINLDRLYAQLRVIYFLRSTTFGRDRLKLNEDEKKDFNNEMLEQSSPLYDHSNFFRDYGLFSG